MQKFVLSEINIYPIKSLGGISLKTAKVENRGLQFDRRWMLVDDENKFISQRTYPQMSLIKVEVGTNGLKVSHKKYFGENIFIPFNNSTEEEIEVKIWDDVCTAKALNKNYGSWFSKILGINCRLVFMPDDAIRKVDSKYSHGNEIVSFADAYPFLLIGQSSLNELNSKLKEAVPMNRFRPNLVFSGGDPFIEDKWKKFRIGNVEFESVKPCARCTITTVDQDTSEIGKEPLATLSQFRKFGNKVLFGQNLIHLGEGTINIGDEFEIIEEKPEV